MKILVENLHFGIHKFILMNKYYIINFSTNKLVVYSLIAFLLTIFSTIITSVYIKETIYPGLVFLVISGISIFIIKNNIWNTYEITLDENNIYIKSKKYELKEIKKYEFIETEKFYGFRLRFNSSGIFLNVPKNNSLEYIQFKKDFIKIVKKHNQKDRLNKITKYNWYNTKVAKIYGYLITAVLVSWITIMFIYSENFKWSRLGLFLMVAGGLFPLLIRIFARKSHNDKEL